MLSCSLSSLRFCFHSLFLLLLLLPQLHHHLPHCHHVAAFLSLHSLHHICHCSPAAILPLLPSFPLSFSPLLLLFTISSYLLSHSLTLIPCLQLKYFIPHHLFNPSFYLSFNLSINISTAFLNPLPYLIYLPFASYKIFNHLTSLPSSSA